MQDHWHSVYRTGHNYSKQGSGDHDINERGWPCYSGTPKATKSYFICMTFSGKHNTQHDPSNITSQSIWERVWWTQHRQFWRESAIEKALRTDTKSNPPSSSRRLVSCGCCTARNYYMILGYFPVALWLVLTPAWCNAFAIILAGTVTSQNLSNKALRIKLCAITLL